jgi:DNA-binding LacI/PurR family transcriptional regulator
MILVNVEPPGDLPEVSQRRVPIVVVGRAGQGVHAVGMDNIGGAQAMIEHLLGQGHRRIAIVTGPRGSHDSTQRLLGCRRALARARVSVPQDFIRPGAFTFASGIETARWFLSARRRPDAIFCLNDAMAIGLIGELRGSGVMVPQEVAVAGFDDVHDSAHLGLTTVAAPMAEIGRVATRSAVKLVENEDVPLIQSLPVRLVVRTSSVGRR